MVIELSTFVYIWICAYMHIYVYVFIFICAYIYIYYSIVLYTRMEDRQTMPVSSSHFCVELPAGQADSWMEEKCRGGQAAPSIIAPFVPGYHSNVSNEPTDMSPGTSRPQWSSGPLSQRSLR